MEKLNLLIQKGKKMVIWNRIGYILFLLGLISLVFTIALPITTKPLFILFSFMLIVPIFIIGSIYDKIVNQILNELLIIFNDRLKWGINNDVIYDSTHSYIEEFRISQYTLVVECSQSYIDEVSNLVREIINDINNDLPPKFKLVSIVRLKL